MKMRLGILMAVGTLAMGASAAPVREVYRVTFDYYYVGITGDIGRRERVAGDYIRDWRSKTAMWRNVTMAAARGELTFGQADPRPVMEAFTYPLKSPNVTDERFFAAIPAATLQDKNLVFDARMFETFGEDEFSHLKPDTAVRFSGSGHDVPLAGAGTFTNKDVQLTWTGTGTRHGRKCAIVDYRALFNPVRIQLPGFVMAGRSHYWGQIWVSLSDKHIEYGTLYEDVLGNVTVQNGAPQTTNVFRTGTFERREVR